MAAGALVAAGLLLVVIGIFVAGSVVLIGMGIVSLIAAGILERTARGRGGGR